MDILEYQQSKAYLNNAGDAKTGLEPTAESQIDTSSQDTTKWQSATTLLGKGLDLGLAIFDKKPKASEAEAGQDDQEIFGMPKMLVYGGIAAVGLIVTVIVIRKMKK